MVINIFAGKEKGGFLPLNLYGELIKGKQTALLLYTAVFTYLISAYPRPVNWSILFVIVTCLFLAISGSTMLNMYIDRDIDAIMPRTKDRALPRGETTPFSVLVHGIFFVVAGLIPLYVWVNLITLVVVFLGFFFDVFVYSLWLKRRTRFSILVGGVAGGLPAVAGRTAVLGKFDLLCLLLMGFILLWIPLHILTLAMIPKNRKGYENAGIPMFPVVSGKRTTTIVVTIAALLTGFLLFTIAYVMQLSLISILPLVPLSGYTIYLSFRNLIDPNDSRTFKLFKSGTVLMAISFLWLFCAKIITLTFPFL